jgi:predicted acylesterase/phospholipase RssA
MLSRGRFMSLFAALGAALTPGRARAASQPPWWPLPPPLPPQGGHRGLVLSGAGARGAYEAGVLKWLFRDVGQDQPFGLICGTSAGAINAAFAAQGTPQSIAQAEEFWKGMPSSNVIQFEPPVQHLMNASEDIREASKHGYPRKLAYLGHAQWEARAVGSPEDLFTLMGVVDDAGIQALMQKYSLSLDTLQTSIFITVTNVSKMSADSFYKFVGPQATQREAAFLGRATWKPRLAASAGAPPLRSRPPLHHALTPGNFSDAVLASASVPAVFDPVTIRHPETDDASLYVDGGVANNTPVSLAVDAGATDLTVVMVSAPDEIPPTPKSIPALLQASFAIMQQRILQSDITLAFQRDLLGRLRNRAGLNRTMQRYIDALQSADWQPLQLRVIQPLEPLKLATIGFNDADGIEAAFEQGYADAQRPFTYTMA